ncbi:MAG: hypothetical protein ABUL58_05105, partial [Steroidobacter sp.]
MELESINHSSNSSCFKAMVFKQASSNYDGFSIHFLPSRWICMLLMGLTALALAGCSSGGD